MEISAIMNIHELAMNREVKQKANSEAKKASEGTGNNPLKAEKILNSENAISQADAEDSVNEEKTFTGNFVNIVT